MFYYTNQFRFNKSGDIQLLTEIAKAINGEYSAIICYEQVAKLAPTEEARKQILEIRQDEIRHYQTFSHIYVTLTGKQHTPQMIEQCKATYTEGLRASFKDEQPEPSNYGAKGALQASALTLSSMLTYALQDEYLAQARYDSVISAFGDVRTFVQIKEAELRHIDALLPLFQKYNTPVPKNIAETLVSTPETIKMAYALGVQGEIDNIGMYERFLTYDIPSDIRVVFTRLRDASRNHLAAFERGLARE